MAKLRNWEPYASFQLAHPERFECPPSIRSQLLKLSAGPGCSNLGHCQFNLGFQKLARIDPESLGKLAKHRDGRAIAARLELADVAAIDFRPKRKLLLSPTLLSSEPPEISSNGVPQIVHQERMRPVEHTHQLSMLNKGKGQPQRAPARLVSRTESQLSQAGDRDAGQSIF